MKNPDFLEYSIRGEYEKTFSIRRAVSHFTSHYETMKMAIHKRPALPRLRQIRHYLTNLVIYGLIKSALLVPYRRRIPMMGALISRIIGPLVGYQKRALENLDLVFPELSDARKKQIARACLNNMGRTVIENYSSVEFLHRLKDIPLTGEGAAELEEARRQNRPVIFATGHFGNYEAMRAVLVAQGYHVGGLYRDMSNPYFNAHYVKTMQAFGGPVFAQGHRGTAGFVRHLKQGGQLVLLFDQRVSGAPELDFLGHPANTAVSAAELALRYNALLIPFFATRKSDGLTFETRLEAPIAPSDPLSMTQELNDRLANHVRQNPENWFWVHRRWG